MGKTLEEQFEDIIYGDIWATGGRDGMADIEGRSDAIVNCTKVAKRYALEQQINLLTDVYDALDSGKIDIDKIDNKREELKIQLEELNNEKG
jgi:hypothetical protein